MELRKVKSTDDLNAISRIYAMSWKTAYKDIVPQQYLDGLSENNWVDKLQNSRYDSFVLIEKDEYIGTSSVCSARDERMSGWGEIISLYLLPDYFGKGFGQSLLAYTVNALLSNGYTDIYLWVLKQNLRARRFYERNGFSLFDENLITIGNEDLPEVRYVYHSI
jgi:ribosomal protein S18 acetylase RimI-like enzyme